MKFLNIFFVLTVLVFLASCSKEEGNDKVTYGTVEMVFTPKAGDTYLSMGNTITTPANEQLTINELKFFISQVAMVDLDGVEYEAEPLQDDSAQAGIWLIDFTQSNYSMGQNDASYLVRFKVPVGAYADNRFAVEVPRQYNLSEISTNPHPVNGSNGMYWSWNSGFKYFVLNGSSPSAGGSGNVHLSIGLGFRAVNYNFRSMVLAAQRPTIDISEGKTTRLMYTYDVNNLLTNVDGSPYSFVQQPNKPNPASVHGGELSTQLQANSVSAVELQDFMVTE